VICSQPASLLKASAKL